MVKNDNNNNINPEGSRDEIIVIHDSAGRPKKVGLEEWKTDGLNKELKDCGSDSTKLYNQIMQAVRYNLAELVLPFAEKLMQTDSDIKRGCLSYAICLAETGKAKEALELLRDYTNKHGKDPSILTNLSKILLNIGKIDAAREVLWESLKLDPNQDTGLKWYVSNTVRSERYLNPYLLEKVFRIPNSWLAGLYLAQQRLEKKDPERALEIYRECLEKVENPSTEFLTKMGIDLTRHERWKEFVEMTAPIYIAKEHGIGLGLLLIDAYLQDSDAKIANEIYEKLLAADEKKWDEILEVQREKIEERRKNITGEGEGVDFLIIDKPIWTRGVFPLSNTLPKKPPNAAKIPILSSVCISSEVTGSEILELKNTALGLSLLLGEFLFICTDGIVATIVPWVQKKGIGVPIIPEKMKHSNYLLTVQPSEFEETIKKMRIPKGFEMEEGVMENLPEVDKKRADYVIELNIMCRPEKWELTVSLVRLKNWIKVRDIFWTFPEKSINPNDLKGIFNTVLQNIGKYTKTKSLKPPSWYCPLDVESQASYMGALRQSNFLMIGALDSLKGSKTISYQKALEQLLQLCKENKGLLLPRLLLLSGIKDIFKKEPKVIEEYGEKIIEELSKANLPSGLPSEDLESIKNMLKGASDGK